MRVLFIATEMDPFFKVGGLGDVISSLPTALARRGVEVSVVIPLYGKIDRADVNYPIESLLMTPGQGGTKVKLNFANEEREIEIYKTTYEGIPVFFIANQGLIGSYGKVAIAGNQAEVDHYAFFSRAVVEWLVQTGTIHDFDILHLHDWHTGLIPRLLHYSNLKVKPKTIFTIHNLGYHGFSQPDLVARLGIKGLEEIKDDPFFDFDAHEDHQLDLLSQGLLGADFITTVSPQYASEIKTTQYCEGLCDVLNVRSSSVRGILNGLDYEVWNSGTDGRLANRFSLDEQATNIDEVIEARVQNKLALQKELGLEANREVAMLGYVGRIDSGQKGLDILLDGVRELLRRDKSIDKIQFVLIGVGETEWEDKFLELETEFSENVSVNIVFDDQLARRIYSATDLMIIPSRYEPCGLVQMISMRYGAIPIVRATGGLKDTVQHHENGFIFEDYSSESLVQMIESALAVYFGSSVRWAQMVEHALGTDFSWDKSASEYVQLYDRVTKQPATTTS